MYGSFFFSIFSWNWIKYWNFFGFFFQLHAKFDKLKKDHADEKRKLEEARKKLEEEFLEFNRRKTQMAASHHTLTLGKKNKKWIHFWIVLDPNQSIHND